MSQICGNCKFWNRRNEKGATVGACLRYPPQIVLIGDSHTGMKQTPLFPVLNANNWCGEWKANAELEAEEKRLLADRPACRNI